MKHKINNNPGPYKRRKSLAAIVYIDIRLLYLLLRDDNCLDNNFKPFQAPTVDPIDHHPVNSAVMDYFINDLINDYRMN